MFRHRPSVLVIATAALMGAAPPVLDGPVPSRLAGRAFQDELQKTVPAAVWRNAELREVFRQFADDRRVAILLDRRLNPNRELSIEIAGKPVIEAVRELAHEVDAAVSVVGNTLYVGPPETAARLRTLVELRSGEFRRLTLELSRERRLELARSATVHWNDLETPRDIVGRITDRYGLEVENRDLIPHDLWASAVLPDADLREALTLVLAQFDFTFELHSDGRSMKIVPIPERVFVEKTYRPRRESAAEALARWPRELPGLEVARDGSGLAVRGTVEQHERLEELLGLRRTPPPVRGAAEPLPVRKRTFTIKQRATPAALIATLEASGIQIEYDRDELAAAGIDLSKPIDLDVEGADADEFFRAWCAPLGLDYEIDGLRVRLVPKK